MNSLPSQDSATGRGIKTFVQAIIGVGIGLIITVWNTPNVPTVVINYLTANVPMIMLAVGVPAGLSSLVWNLFREDLKKY